MKPSNDRLRRRFLKSISMLGLTVAFSLGAMIQAFVGSKSRTNQDSKTSATQPASEQVSDKTAIRPFHFNFSDAQLADSRRRIKTTIWPERKLVNDPSQGVQLATMQPLQHCHPNQCCLGERLPCDLSSNLRVRT